MDFGWKRGLERPSVFGFFFWRNTPKVEDQVSEAKNRFLQSLDVEFHLFEERCWVGRGFP